MRLALAALAALLVAASAHAQEVVQFPTPARTNPVAAIEGKVYRPAGAGPFPAVVLMHGCGGPSANVPVWWQFFAANGIAALEVIGFRPRGIDEVCTKVASASGITLRDRAYDAYGGLAWLQQQSWVDPRRVVVMGFSHGGSTTLTAASLGFPRPHPGKPDFAAAIPVYPGCNDFDLDSAMPMFVLTGERDDWTPSKPCERKAARAKAAGYDVRLSVMAGAHHSFDSPSVRGTWLPTVRNGSKPGGCCGATVAGSVAAREQAEREVLAFLQKELRPAADQASGVRRPPALADEAMQEAVRAAAALAPDDLLSALNETGGRFEGFRFHVYALGPDGRFLAHARYPYVVGTAHTGKSDDGKAVVELLQQASSGDGWGRYRSNRTEIRFHAVRAGDRLVVGIRY